MSSINERIKKSKDLREAIWKNFRLGKPNQEEAKKILIEVLNEEPDNTRALINLGAILCDMGDREEGILFLRRAESLGSIDQNLYLNIAIAMTNMHAERQNARAYFEKAYQLEKDPLTIESYFDPHGG